MALITDQTASQATSWLNLADRQLAYQQIDKKGAVEQGASLFFLSGYGSDMLGSKASYLAAQSAAAGLGFTRFDYRGCGQTSGKLIDYTLGDWLEDALAVFDQLTKGPQILIGSSMGGWVALLLALKRPERVAGLIGIAAAPDFTERLIWRTLAPEQRKRLEQTGVIEDESLPPEQRLPISLRFIEEARQHLLLDGPIEIEVSVRLLQGQQDEEVPWRAALELADSVEGDDVQVILVKDGNHRLSRPQDLALLWRVVESFGLLNATTKGEANV